MNHRPERVGDLFFLRKKNMSQLNSTWYMPTCPRSKQVYQVNDFPQDDLFQALVPGHQKCERFYHREKRAGTWPLYQVKCPEIPPTEIDPIALSMLPGESLRLCERFYMGKT
jgi:hypothetical protein